MTTNADGVPRMESFVRRFLWTWSVWGRGSGGFGFGIWRTWYVTHAIWTIAIGPFSFYFRRL